MFKTILFTSFMMVPFLVHAQETKLSEKSIDKIVNLMTLDEKLNLLIGSEGNAETDASATIGSSSVLVPGAAGQLNAIPRFGIPNTVLADGPAGLRISPKREGTSDTFYCTHFPIETLMSSTWNTQLVQSVGTAMGEEVKHYGADVLLAPATNIQRNPLNGRNFEYYSEDPLLSGKMAAAMIKGVQSVGVGTSLKHFALNNQETNRTNNNVIGNPRTFREIYLKPFEIAVKESQPWTIMTSYNMINGTYSSERSDLVTEILRKEWGFKGMVMTDWYGGQHATLQMEAGNDLLMPGKLAQRIEIRNAVLNGKLSMEIIDRNVKHVLRYILKTPHFKGYIADNQPDLKAHATVTRHAATEGMVLLKNLGNTLPLNHKIKKVAAFGRTSYDFIAGGTGSGNVNHAYVISLIEGLQNAQLSVDKSLKTTYKKYISVAKANKPIATNRFAAFLPKHLIPEMDLSQINLTSLADKNDVAIITIGKTSGEFADRHIDNNFNLTSTEKKMISQVTNAFHKRHKKVILILNVCGVVETESWIANPDAVLVSWLPGQEGGNSVADILTGKQCPSGHLPMTWPIKYVDTPSKEDFPIPDSITDKQLIESLKGFSTNRTHGEVKNFDYTTYNDGIYVGYRYYTTKQIPVSFPFGYGLSYTTFKYSDLAVSKEENGDLNITVNIKNTGKVSGKEVVQVYISAPGEDMDKPVMELKGFAKTHTLIAGQQQHVSITIPYESLASFNEKASRWQVESGVYKVIIARNAADRKPKIATVSEIGNVTELVKPCLSLEQK